MYVSLSIICGLLNSYFLISQLLFSLHSRLWSCRKFFTLAIAENIRFILTSFLSYTVEILPYALRAKGFVVFNFIISLSLIFNQYVTSFLHPSLWLSVIVDMWTRLRLASKSLCWLNYFFYKYSSLTRLGWKYYVCSVLQTCALLT